MLERIKNFEEEKKQDKETIEELRKQVEDSLQQIQSHKLQVDSAKSENQKEIEALESSFVYKTSVKLTCVKDIYSCEIRFQSLGLAQFFPLMQASKLPNYFNLQSTN